jgi:hypothetical protein
VATEKEIKEEVKDELVIEKPKYEIKSVFKSKFPSNVSIKSINNLSILKSLEINDTKNWFVIKKNYKTFVFTLKDANIEGSNRYINLKATSNSLSTEIDRSSNSGGIYLEIYGISEPDESFLNDIVSTIKPQIDQINLIQRAKKIFRRTAIQEDYEYINEDSDRLMVAFKIPIFIRSYYKFLNDLRSKLMISFIEIEMGPNQRMDILLEQTSRENAKSVLKRLPKSEINHSSFYNPKQLSSSMAGEPPSIGLFDGIERNNSVHSRDIIEEKEENEEIDSPGKTSVIGNQFKLQQNVLCFPKTREEAIAELEDKYSRESFTLLYIGIDPEETAKRTNTSFGTKTLGRDDLG